MSRTRFALSVTTAALFSVTLLAACTSDTLYDAAPDDITAPFVEVTAPVPGLEVVAGRSFRVHVFAADSLGIVSLQVELSGAASDVISRTYDPAQTTIELDTVISTPANVQGSLQLRARVRNALGGLGTASVVLRVAATDTIAPTVSVIAEIPARVELTDTFTVRVTARDNEGGSGLSRLGFTGMFVNATSPADTFVVPGAVRELSQASHTEQVFELRFAPTFVNPATLPHSLTFEVHAFAVDSAGNCVVAVTGSTTLRPCRAAVVGGAQVVLGGTSPGGRIPTVVVSGRSVTLPAGAGIADALPDVTRQRLYLSNLPGYRLEVLNLGSYSFETSVAVGAQPWGLAFNRQRDTVLVANSGGTSISSVALTGQPREVLSRRFHTPNLVLFQLILTQDTAGNRRIEASFQDFSDRPQFLAQDSEGRVLFSTKPTPAASDGTIRVAENEPGWAVPEVRLLTTRAGAIVQGGQAVAIAHIDSLRVWRLINGDDFVELFDHVNGFPDQIIRTGVVPLEDALNMLVEDPDSDIFWSFGRWNRSVLGLSDTTFVAASADRRRVAFGEGATAAGRVMLWNAELGDISNELTTADFVGNSAERILGVDLNGDGTLGVARGTLGSYYFTDDLRLQGSDVEAATAAGGAGANLFPAHPTYRPFPSSGAATLSFVATNQQSIKILDTVHFSERGEIQLRDNIVGPLRVSPPLPGDPCVQGACPVAKLYGVTSAGAVVVVDVLTTQIGAPF